MSSPGRPSVNVGREREKNNVRRNFIGGTERYNKMCVFVCKRIEK